MTLLHTSWLLPTTPTTSPSGSLTTLQAGQREAFECTQNVLRRMTLAAHAIREALSRLLLCLLVLCPSLTLRRTSPVIGVLIFVERQRPVPSSHHKHIPVLGQVVHSPQRGVLPSTPCSIHTPRKAAGGMLCASVVQAELGIQAAGHELVHGNITAVKLQRQA
jgi:hypothetical protein